MENFRLAYLGLALAALAGCSAMVIEGDCTYERTVTTSYQCLPGAKIDHKRVSPGATPE
jgi:hypothetical protein